MNSRHDHHHGHQYDKKNGSGLAFEEKLVKIFEHWIKHNESHAQNYLDWRLKAQEHGLDEIAARLEEIAQLSARLTEKLKAGLNEAKSSC